MAQRKIATYLSYGSYRDATEAFGVAKVRSERGPDEDLFSLEYQRKHQVGPDYDPNYFEKLQTLIEENYGPLGEFRVVNG
ncbi:hypothetical protein [Rhizobium sp. RAF56]|jgi:hypothetical protein|uniref:hypothetical protein n=1 Tax=Rhizobium sp. RAF56 TaxID=3233062 RepID=UPI003F9497D7